METSIAAILLRDLSGHDAAIAYAEKIARTAGNNGNTAMAYDYWQAVAQLNAWKEWQQ